MARTDTHRPSLLDPAEYSYLGCFYQGSSDAMADSYMYDMRELAIAVETFGATQFQGNHADRLTCDHCGASFAHGACFLHIPTSTYITVGHICASDTIGLPSRAAKAKRTAEKAAAEEKARLARHAANAVWANENEDVIVFLASPQTHPFLLDMVATLDKWGNLSERQAAATRKFIAGAAKFAAAQAERENEAAPESPLIEGRREITGTVLSTKWIESFDYGSQPKMLVKEADGNKVWGTVAESIFSQGFDTDGLKGETVTFKATVKRSKDDEHFGFYKRPSGARVIEKEVAAA